MSVALFVRLKRPVPLDEIEAASTAALRELLNLECQLRINAEFDQSDRVGDSSGEFLTDSSSRVVCSLLGYQEKVAVTPFTTPVQTSAEDGSCHFVDQNYLSVKWDFNKTPVCWALVAAVAVGLAKGQDSDIEDNAGFFTKLNIQKPSEFCCKLRLATPQADLEVAATELYARMPKSAEIAEWLKSRPTT